MAELPEDQILKTHLQNVNKSSLPRIHNNLHSKDYIGNKKTKSLDTLDNLSILTTSLAISQKKMNNFEAIKKAEEILDSISPDFKEVQKVTSKENLDLEEFCKGIKNIKKTEVNLRIPKLSKLQLAQRDEPATEAAAALEYLNYKKLILRNKPKL